MLAAKETQVISVSDALDLLSAALIRAGAAEKNAHIQARHLVQAEAKGHPSHGLLRLPRLIERISNGVADPNATGHHHWSGTALCQVNGARGLGPVVMYSAIEALRARLDETGLAMAVIDNCNHLGMLAHYAEAAAKDGLVALLLTTSEALVHPWGARHAMIGTNPLAIGVPGDPPLSWPTSQPAKSPWVKSMPMAKSVRRWIRGGRLMPTAIRQPMRPLRNRGHWPPSVMPRVMLWALLSRF